MFKWIFVRWHYINLFREANSFFRERNSRNCQLWVTDNDKYLVTDNDKYLGRFLKWNWWGGRVGGRGFGNISGILLSLWLEGLACVASVSVGLGRKTKEQDFAPRKIGARAILYSCHSLWLINSSYVLFNILLNKIDDRWFIGKPACTHCVPLFQASFHWF